MWFRSGEFFCQNELIVVPEQKGGFALDLQCILTPTGERHLLEFGLQVCDSKEQKGDLRLGGFESEEASCVCVTNKGNTQVYRVLVGSRSISSMVIIVVYVNFTEMDNYAKKEFVMLVTCAL